MSETPEFDPEEKITLGEIINALGTEAYVAEQSAEVWPGQVAADYRRRGRVFDAAHKIFVAMLPNWRKHKELMQQNPPRKNQQR